MLFQFFDSGGLTRCCRLDGENMLIRQSLIVAAITMIAVSGCKKADDQNAPSATNPPATQQAMPPTQPATPPAPAPASSTPDAAPAASSSSGSAGS
jgi:hypothetical protein